eukprot:9918226-Heterocapsa_arctica.AAC.1
MRKDATTTCTSSRRSCSPIAIREDTDLVRLFVAAGQPQVCTSRALQVSKQMLDTDPSLLIHGAKQTT